MSLRCNVVIGFLLWNSSSAFAKPFHVDPPSLAVSNNSLEAISIANKINHFFQTENTQPKVQEVTVFDDNENLGDSQLNLKFNVNLQIQNGKPQKMSLPQGNLILMFVPDTEAVTEKQIEDFMKATNGPTSTTRTQGGVLFTSWLNENKPLPNYGPIMARSDSLPTTITNDQEIKAGEIIDGLHDQLTQDDEIRRKWNSGNVPKFPFYHSVLTEDIKTNQVLPKEQKDILGDKAEMLESLLKDLKKKYRQDDGIDITPHINRNSVTAGELSRPVGQMTSNVECSEINGETVCRRKSSSCTGSFGMGCDENNIVPFSQPQSSMNMRTTTTTTRRPPLIRRRFTRDPR